VQNYIKYEDKIFVDTSNSSRLSIIFRKTASCIYVVWRSASARLKFIDQKTYLIVEEVFIFYFYFVTFVDHPIILLAIFVFPNCMGCGANIQET